MIMIVFMVEAEKPVHPFNCIYHAGIQSICTNSTIMGYSIHV